MSTPILETRKLTKIFSAEARLFGGRQLANKAVDAVSICIEKGETLGLVGESGCGKSTLAATIMRLYRPSGGKILFDGHDISDIDERSLKPFRKRMQMVFQDPITSLDPKLTVEQIVTEPLEIHAVGDRIERRELASNALEKVGLSGRDLGRFPSEFSTGQQQRISIARSIILNPELIVCDEPVSSLDVSIQAQILNLLLDLQDDFGIAYLFISHDIAATSFMSTNIAVMYRGQVVESGPTKQITEDPRHPYTQSLLRGAAHAGESWHDLPTLTAAAASADLL
jgi:oligopeptide transport system ATP-binding protein